MVYMDKGDRVRMAHEAILLHSSMSQESEWPATRWRGTEEHRLDLKGSDSKEGQKQKQKSWQMLRLRLRPRQGMDSSGCTMTGQVCTTA